MNYYISDTHFGHENVIKFDNRPFNSVLDMENTMILNWNSVVENNDTVYILGDFCWSRNENEWIRVLDQLNGNKVLIRGNHDIKNMSNKLKKKFADIKDYKEITDDNKHVIMSHYPILLYKGSYNTDIFMLCGHIHITKEDILLEKWRSELKQSCKDIYDNKGNIINVGCMKPYMNYTPKSLKEIINIIGE